MYIVYFPEPSWASVSIFTSNVFQITWLLAFPIPKQISWVQPWNSFLPTIQDPQQFQAFVACAGSLALSLLARIRAKMLRAKPPAVAPDGAEDPGTSEAGVPNWKVGRTPRADWGKNLGRDGREGVLEAAWEPPTVVPCMWPRVGHNNTWNTHMWHEFFIRNKCASIHLECLTFSLLLAFQIRRLELLGGRFKVVINTTPWRPKWITLFRTRLGVSINLLDAFVVLRLLILGGECQKTNYTVYRCM